ncbi:MAG: hypothetical protein ACYSXF_10125 [Planctomycetota bacterium]|jgi:hypothetical protein
MMIERFRSGAWRLACRDGAWGFGLIVAACASRMHVGGAINVLMPALLGLSLLVGLALAEARTGRGSFRRLVPWLMVLQCAMLAVDFGDGNPRHPPRPQDPRDYLPTDADRQAWERLVAILRDTEGDVIVPKHGYLPRMVGKAPGAHAMAVIDVLRGSEPELRIRLRDAYLDSARNRSAELVVFDERAVNFQRLISPGYVEAGRIVPPDDPAMMPVVPLKTRPVILYRRTR